MQTTRFAKMAFLFLLAMGMLLGFPLSSLAQDKLFLLEPLVTRDAMIKQANAALREILEHRETESVRIGKADASLISNNENELILDLGQDAPLVAEKQAFKTNTDGIAVWRGRVEDKNAKPYNGPNEISPNAFNSVILIRHGQNITGTIHFKDQLYSILPIGGNKHAIIKVDARKFPEDEPPVLIKNSRNDQIAASQRSGKTKIRVMIIVSNQAAEKIDDIQALATAAFEDANQGFANSGIQIEFENAGVFHVNYNETGTYGNILSQLADTSNQALGAPVHKLREEYAADVVTLFVNQHASCGMAYLGANNKGSAYNVVTYYCAVGSHSFAHEIGHNLGAGHAGSGGRFPYGHGYQQQSVAPRWRTIMASNCSLSCPRINAWSNPRKTYAGLPMGTVEHNDNVRLLNERREIVASFYPLYGWHQVGELKAVADLPPRQLFEISLKNKETGKEVSSADILPQKLSMYQWPAEVAQAINTSFPETMLRAGEPGSDDKIEPVAGSSYRNKIFLNKKDHGNLEFSMARKTYALVNDEKWIDVAAIRSSAALPVGSTVAVTLRDKTSETEVNRMELVATSDNNGMYAWPAYLARKVNEENLPNLRAGELQEDGSIQVVVGSGYRNQIWIPVAQRSKLAVALVHTEISNRHAYQYKYPENITQYKAKTRVLGKDGNIYECKPLPYAEWCRVYSPSANQYEPGRGSNWRDAWEKIGGVQRRQ